jgi:hypothetical protein
MIQSYYKVYPQILQYPFNIFVIIHLIFIRLRNRSFRSALKMNKKLIAISVKPWYDKNMKHIRFL